MNPKYSSQFPGLASCIPAGPAIVHVTCTVGGLESVTLIKTRTITSQATLGTFTSMVTQVTTMTEIVPPVAGNEQAAAGGDLTETKQIYVTMPGMSNMQAPKEDPKKLPIADEKAPGADSQQNPTDGKKDPPIDKVPVDDGKKTSPDEGKKDPPNTTPSDDGKKTSSDDKKDPPKVPTDDSKKTSSDDEKKPPKDNTSDDKKSDPNGDDST